MVFLASHSATHQFLELNQILRIDQFLDRCKRLTINVYLFLQKFKRISLTLNLRRKSENVQKKSKYIVYYEDLYEKIYAIHVAKPEHVGQIPRPAVKIFLTCCKISDEKKSGKKIVVKPII